MTDAGRLNGGASCQHCWVLDAGEPTTDGDVVQHRSRHDQLTCLLGAVEQSPAGLVQTAEPAFPHAEAALDHVSRLAVGCVECHLLPCGCCGQRCHQPRLQRITRVAYRQIPAVCLSFIINSWSNSTLVNAHKQTKIFASCRISLLATLVVQGELSVCCVYVSGDKVVGYLFRSPKENVFDRVVYLQCRAAFLLLFIN